MWREVLRAFKFALDPTPVQAEALARHTGAAWWAFDYALAVKVPAHQRWQAEVAGLVAQGAEEAEARRRVQVPVPSKPQIQKRLNEVKGGPGSILAPHSGSGNIRVPGRRRRR
ncbi:helix-turn-helix domain-containing protein [Streptomyces roseolus]|uniref:helix-turn-helix domain-containing protein n=1 Tax=Streptomyces roseolus TaxID=67358 RepID=UPI00167B5632|nr:helix-turn-helix domain-containing protein [Streptomyces roseolus]GGR66087.1 hypothetical protein GCM10010282_68890 [Streptomyces roseolus]